MAAGKSVGYERWTKIFNLKEAAKTLNFLVDNGLTDYDKLSAKADRAGDVFMTFFFEEDSCLPLYELMSTHPGWDTSKLIVDSALKRAIAKHCPSYARSHKELEGRKGEHGERIFLLKESVEELENAGRDFLTFWK